MNILILYNSSITKQGDKEIRISEVIEGLNKKGHKITIFNRLSKKSKENIFLWPLIVIISRGLNFIRLYLFDLNCRLIDSKIFEILSTIFLFFNKNKKFNIAFLYEYMPKLAMHLRRQGVHVITDIALTPEKYKLNNLSLYSENKIPYSSSIDKYEQDAIKNSDQCICINQITYEMIRYKISPYTKAHLCHYKYMGKVNLKESITKREKIIKSKKVNFLIVGDISNKKGTHLILEAWPTFIEWSKLNHERFEFELHIIGRNYMNKDLNNLQNVNYHGLKKPQQFYLLSHYFLSTSIFDGNPKVLAEAKACGCVPIVSEVEVASKTKNRNYDVKIENLSSSAVLISLIKATQLIPRWSIISNLIAEKEFSLKKYSDQISSLIETNRNKQK